MVVLMVMVVVPAMAGGFESILKQLVLAKVAEKNPEVGEVLQSVVRVNGETVQRYPQQRQLYRQPIYSSLQAESLTQQHQALIQSDSYWIMKGKQLGNSNRWQEALACFQKAVSLNMNSVEGHYCASIAYKKLGQGDTAEIEYRI